MRLSQIKLAGFKSFVDLTKVPFPHQMTAVVGPNGCGKSNIIDAVRWVLGESSAKNLRGDAMTDVIFNGASSRKSVGQASVELIFDNKLASLPLDANGEPSNAVQANLAAKIADRNEISVKRIVNRDGTNHYYLNGSKCRRRDITDIFLGTGLGPRSYAIIEQGTISRLIESKPQELRVFIEEAAGISKYKERRRETENKIKHTRENLARVDDLQYELEQQLTKLTHQAEVAKQFKKLKAQERELKSEFAAIKWQKAQQKLASLTKQLEQSAQIIERQSHEKNNLSEKLNGFQQQQAQLLQTIDEYQQEILTKHRTLVALEQNQQHLSQNIERCQQKQLDIAQQASHFDDQEQNINTQLAAAAKEQQLLTPQLAQITDEITELRAQLSQKQAQIYQMQSTWQQLSQQSHQHQQAKIKIEAELANITSNISQVEQQLANCQQQINAIAEPPTDERSVVQLEENTKQLTAAKEKLIQAKMEFSQAVAVNQALAVSVSTAQIKCEAANNLLAQLLEQKAPAKSWQASQQAWLLEVENQLKQQGEHQEVAAEFNTELNSFSDYLTVDKKWQTAVEQVLEHLLDAIVIDSFSALNTLLIKGEISLDQCQQCFLISREHLTKEIAPNSLAEIVNSKIGVPQWFNQVLLVESAEQAQQNLPELQSGQSLLTASGIWLSQHMVRKGGLVSVNNSLALAEKITAQQALIANHETNIEQNHVQALQAERDVIASEKLVEQLQQQVSLIENEHSRLTQALTEQQQLTLSSQASREQLAKQIEQLTINLAKLIEEQVIAEQAMLQQGDVQQDQNAIIDSAREQEQLQHDIRQLQQKLDAQQNSFHQLNINLEQAKLSVKHAEQALSNCQQSQSQLVMTRQQVEHELQALVLQAKQSEDLAKASQDLADIEEKQQQAKELLSQINRQQTSQQLALEQLMIKLDDEKVQLNKLRLDKETQVFNRNAAQEQLREYNFTEQIITEQTILSLLPAQPNEQQCQHSLKRISTQLGSLGPVNLAAIDEYQQLIERKNHIDLQIDDLTKAISTLESVIKKIDNESRDKFKTTFDKVNHDLSTLFPKVFGGGSAYLALTGEDLLETGVSIMARPPGKKNSTIHLLSGGEKALTALSLVFAIFRLNPAPFCMLDEVDAPLDDTNVERFCTLVREMSQTVQFIYISHNKIAMEMASHLTGITMQEPGVSRLVSVDIDEAIAMAEVS